MNKTERDELRRVIRTQLKVLRADVTAREAELKTDLEAKITAHFAASNKEWEDFKFTLRQVLDAANREGNDLARSFYGNESWGLDADQTLFGLISHVLSKPGVGQETQMRREGYARISEQVAQALQRLNRLEADLTKELAITALESADARAFLARIPEVSELVPADRVAQIVADISGQEPAR